MKVHLGEVDMADKVRSSKRAMRRFLTLAIRPHAISSTAVRAQVNDPIALRTLVTEPVADFIEQHGLYQH